MTLLSWAENAEMSTESVRVIAAVAAACEVRTGYSLVSIDNNQICQRCNFRRKAAAFLRRLAILFRSAQLWESSHFTLQLSGRPYILFSSV